MSVPDTAIVIPVHNGMDRLPKCLDSLDWASDEGVKLVIVDAGSTDGTGVWLREEAPYAVVITGDESMWWTASVDLGCRHAIRHLGARRLALLNDDCTWDRSSFRATSEALDRHPGNIVCSKVRRADDERVCFAGGMRARSGLLTVRLPGPRAEDPSSGPVVWCGGQGVLFESRIYVAVGGFDPRWFPHYFGDSDFCLRAKKRGFPTWYCAESTVLNDTSTSGVKVPREGADVLTVWRSLVSRRSANNIRDNVLFYLRHGGCKAVPALVHLLYLSGGSSTMRLIRGMRW